MTEALIFEMSVEGKKGVTFPESDIRPLSTSPQSSPSPSPFQGEGKRDEKIPGKFFRKNLPKLPEVSEPEVVRHFTRLSQLNFSADTHFYPLGSCTMKYNPKVNEVTSALPGFSNAHPYQNDSTLQGTLKLLYELERILCELTGMDAFSLHPAAGAQGELVGLLVTKAYFESKREKRNKVIVPDTAHGTNPASAALAGFSVVSVPSNKKGRTDLEALKKMLDKETALVMITCPNTLGLFEDEIEKIAELVHLDGALLYMDGANFNALVGMVQPAKLGFDMMHLNLHKTFSVPHGGGGPGAGPFGVVKSLEKFLPTPRIKKDGEKYQLISQDRDSIGQVRSFFGNTGALIRAYTYILSLGIDGLKSVSENAILNANYLLVHLKDAFKPFVDENCMHECVLSASAYAKNGTKTLDIVKRLLDYGFYAPTIYFPLIVPEALMVEPTETESKKSLDDFVQAMKKIIQECRENPELVHSAPHTTPVKRLDEVTAARQPILRWR